MWTGESGYFRIRWRSKFVSNLLSNSKPIWRHNSNNWANCRHYCALYGACSELILLQRCPWYYSESGYHRMRVDRRIPFEYATCRRGNFKSAKKKLRMEKYRNTCGRALVCFPLYFSPLFLSLTSYCIVTGYTKIEISFLANNQEKISLHGALKFRLFTICI